MKIECSIDGKALSLSVNSNKPLSLILTEDVGNRSLVSYCQGNGCGNCIVLLNEEAVLSCMIPAFRLKDSTIRTFDSFQKTRQYRDIERAYRATGNNPCPNCYASKTLIIESILQDLTNSHPGKLGSTLTGRIQVPQDNDEIIDEKNIVQELSLNTCTCMDMSEMLQIVEIALGYRRRKRVRRN
ncbi:2Fe-2S iron-sulfur cluster-binding protein [uncultured Sphaerochaeta sp.]|uniref:2Fe-2S iron-sulfur cluster-binding protein n=1 Tax=uncultured Sphaerochaeta sp. TaxID=886478 RepID=UPI002A0A2954|nr:2Fe-2S iron-sulfur cluster-binding protein [uncultured Sphaerochaeta sp.]